MVHLISTVEASNAATATSLFFARLPLEMRCRVYGYYFQNYIISCTSDEQDTPQGCLAYMPDPDPQTDYWSNAAMTRLYQKTSLSSCHEGQIYMAYGTAPDHHSHDVLLAQPLWPLLCVSRQTYEEAALLLAKHVRFSFRTPGVLVHALATNPEMMPESKLKIPTLLKSRGYFDTITTLQVDFGSGPENNHHAKSLSWGRAFASLPKLERLVLDMLLTAVIANPSHLPRPWLAEMLWHTRVKSLQMIDTRVNSLEGARDGDGKIVADAYRAFIQHHCQPSTSPAATSDVDSQRGAMAAGGVSLLRDENDSRVLRRSIFDAVWQHIVSTPGRQILKYRLSKGKDRYCSTSWSPRDGFQYG